jgi:hypothetical protein
MFTRLKYFFLNFCELQRDEEAAILGKRMKRNAVLIRHKLVISHPRDRLLKRLPADFVFGIVRCYIKKEHLLYPRIIKKARQLYHMFDGLAQCSVYMIFWYGSGCGSGSSDPLTNGSLCGSGCGFRQWPSRCPKTIFFLYFMLFPFWMCLYIILQR